MLIDLTGKRFGRWTVLAIAERQRRHGRYARSTRVRWLCRCDCGTERIVLGQTLRSGQSNSCGCLKREMAVKRNTKHGMWGTRVYKCWSNIKTRCFNPRHDKHHHYGGRGITVGEDWRKSFEAFYADVGNPPPGMSLDRIDNDGNYERGNTRWATQSIQIANRRPNKQTKKRRY